MRAFDWGCVALVSAVIGVAAACGGRLQTADCGGEAFYCEATDVCCPTGYVCGTGTNGCPARGCCASSASSSSSGGPASAPPQQGFSAEPYPPSAPAPTGGPAAHPFLQ